jgi:uncharacterized membrane protein YqjE
MMQRLRSVLVTLVDGFSTRFDLASVELEDLLARLGVMVGLILAGSLAAGFALFFLSWAIVEAVPQNHRWIAALALALLYGAGAGFACKYLRRALREMPAPFATTRSVLRRDIAALRPVEPPVAPTPDSASGDNVP